MEHLALEIFDLEGTGSRYAVLPEDTAITITDTSEIFASGDVWSHSFTLNAEANVHIFGSAGEMHGSRLHDQLDRRRARLWVENLPLYLGYLRLDEEAEVDADGNVDVRFESGQKTFEDMIDGVSAQEVSVGDVPIGIALNRKRVARLHDMAVWFTLDGLEGYAVRDPRLDGVREATYSYGKYKDLYWGDRNPHVFGDLNGLTPHMQRWPKLVKSYGRVLDSSGASQTVDYTNVQTPYDTAHPFCNLNICYPLKVNKLGEEVAARGYTVRLAHGEETTDGGDKQTRFNNAPNFYLLYFIDRLFKDMKIHIEENQAMDVEDLRRVFLLNYGCFYEEIEDAYATGEINSHLTPVGKRDRYGQYYMPIIDGEKEKTLIKKWQLAGYYALYEDWGLDEKGKVLLREVTVTDGSETLLNVGSIEGKLRNACMPRPGSVVEDKYAIFDEKIEVMTLNRTQTEAPSEDKGYYSAYLAYATGENYPKADISEIIDAMKSMFGVRLLFSKDYSSVRIVLLRNVFRSQEVQELACEVVAPDVKVENGVRGFRMTYGRGTDDTTFYYKGFADMFSRAGKLWRDTSDKHDYSQWKLDADYDEIKQYVSAMNKKCYVTPVTGNAYIIKVDEDEDVLFPSLFEAAGFMDAEDGDCSRLESEPETVEEVQASGTPVIMSNIDDTYASLFSGDMKAPAPDITTEDASGWDYAMKLATYGRVTTESRQVSYTVGDLTISGWLDIYVAEGFQMRLLDNYGVSNVGTPFDDADPGLQLGIMRSSGSDAHVRYYRDPDDNENDTWEVKPGSNAVCHPDTCDEHGSLWDYDAEAGRQAKVSDLRTAGWSVAGDPDDTVLFSHEYTIHDAEEGDVKFNCTPARYFPEGARPSAIDPYGGRPVLTRAELESLVSSLWSDYGWSLTGHDAWKVVLSASNGDRGTVIAEGRFSLKLRAEKPNPYFDPSKEETHYDPAHPEENTNPRYLHVDGTGLQGRGLMDQFYKEYSKWAREARIAKRTVRIGLAELLAIDKTKRVRIGDVTGFIRKMQYQVSSKDGLGTVEMEIMYI